MASFGHDQVYQNTKNTRRKDNCSHWFFYVFIWRTKVAKTFNTNCNNQINMSCAWRSIHFICYNGMHQQKTNYKVSLLLWCLEQTIHYLAALHFLLLEVLFVENDVTLASLLCCHNYGDLILYTSLNIILINHQAIPS